MEQRLIDVNAVKSVLKKVGIASDEFDKCMGWTSPPLDKPLTGEDAVLAELTSEEQGFLRCMN
jgi:hypothetical protein